MMEVYLNDPPNNAENDFDVLSFERKVVELVEELRLRRSMETENERALKSCMEEKYKLENELDELKRRHNCEKESLEQQITLIKRKLEDNVCISDDEKTKQQIVYKTYSQEVRILKKELQKAESEKLNLVKRIQGLESQLKLHNNYQESIMKELAEIRNRFKTLIEDCEELKASHKGVMENFTQAKENFQKFNKCNDYFHQSITIIEKKNESLWKNLITCRAELTMARNSAPISSKTKHPMHSIEKLQERNLELENLFLQSRKENEKTLSNLVESNKKLCNFMNKYSESKESEKSLLLKIKQYENDLEMLQTSLSKKQDELNRYQVDIVNKKEAIQNNYKVAETQTSGKDSVDEDKKLPDVIIGKQDTFSIETKGINIVNSATLNKDEKADFFKIGEQTVTFSQIAKRKRSTDDEECSTKLKKPCYTNTDGLINNQNQMVLLNMDEDKSQQSSLSCSQNSISCYDIDSKKVEETISATVTVSVKEKDFEMKDLITVQNNLKNLQVFDPESSSSLNTEEADIKKTITDKITMKV